MLLDLPVPVVEAGFAVGASVGNYMLAGDAARGLAGTGTAGPDVVWTDITAYLQRADTRIGSTRVQGPIIRYEAGTATIVLKNGDGRFDPANTGGPYTSGGVTQVAPMRAIRIRAAWAGVTYDVWRGFIDSVDLVYPGKSPNFATATFSCSDGMKVLSSYERVAGGNVGAGEDSGARVTRILDSAGWPTADRVIAAGDSTLQATDLDGNVLDELQLVADSELGEFYLDQAGRAVFRNRHALLEDARSTTSQATFGDGAGELPYSDISPEYDDTQLINLVQVSRVGGSTQTVQDDTSQSAYLTHSFTRSDLLLQSDTVVADWAGFLLYQSKDPELRFAAITVPARRDSANLLPQLLGRQIGDRVTVTRRPPGGFTNSRDVFVRGVAHEITLDSWRTTFTFQSATKYAFMIADDPVLGRADENAAGY